LKIQSRRTMDHRVAPDHELTTVLVYYEDGLEYRAARRGLRSNKEDISKRKLEMGRKKVKTLLLGAKTIKKKRDRVPLSSKDPIDCL